MKDPVTERALAIAKEDFGWNQVQFAKAVGVEKQHVSNWLKRRMPPEVYAKVAATLTITVEQLLTGVKPESPGDLYAANRVAETVAGYGINVSREGFLFAAEWEKLREPVKSQVLALVHSIVRDQVLETRKKPGSPRDDRPQV